MAASSKAAHNAQESENALSTREREILVLVGTGATNRQIARELTISINTVKTHLRNIYTKLGVESRTEATLYGIQHGLIRVAGAPAQSPAAAEAGETLVAPAPHLVRWPLLPAQRVAMLMALVLALMVALWPDARTGSSSQESRFVDVPQAAHQDLQLEEVSRWSARSQMPAPRGRFAQAAVEGKILVIGGLTEEGATDRVECYDPSSDRWDRRAPKPTAIGNIGAAVVGGLVYVPGGCDEAKGVRDVLEVYDPAADTWATGASLPVPLCSYAIAPVGGGFYLLGGWNGQSYVDSTYYYDAGGDTWRQETPLRSARGFAAAAMAGDRIYLTGGSDGVMELSSCESYDPALAKSDEDPWRVHAPMSVGRAGHCVEVAEGYLYAVGGGWGSYFEHNERYDIANDVWSSFDSPLTGEWRTLGLTAIAGREGTYLYAIGGWSGRYLSVVEAYRATYRIYLP